MNWQKCRREVFAEQLIHFTAEELAKPANDAETVADELGVTRAARRYITAAPGTAEWKSEGEVRRREKLRQRVVESMDRQRHAKMRTSLHDCSVDCDWPGECHQVLEQGKADQDGDDDEYMDYILLAESDEEEESGNQVAIDEVEDDKETVVPDTTQYDTGMSQWNHDAHPYSVQYINGHAYPQYEANHARNYGYEQYIDYDAYPMPETETEDQSSPEEHLREDGNPPLDPAMWDSVESTSGGAEFTQEMVQTSPTSPESSDDESQTHEAEKEASPGSESGDNGNEQEEETQLLEMHAALGAGQ